jgi:hypothetical protein
MKIQTANELGSLICKALGVDVSRVTEIHIHCEAGEAARATIHMCIDKGAQLEELVKRYQLVPLKSTNRKRGKA